MGQPVATQPDLGFNAFLPRISGFFNLNGALFHKAKSPGFVVLGSIVDLDDGLFGFGDDVLVDESA